jgi:hypothetical protein
MDHLQERIGLYAPADADVAISNTVVPAKSSFFTFVSLEIHPTSVEWDTSVP